METVETGGAVESAPESTEVVNEQVETQDEGQVTETQAEKKAEIPQALKKKLKLKVDGEEIEDEIDFNDEEGLKRKLQLSYAAKKRMEEAKAAKAKAFEIIKAFEEDPANVFKKLGPKGREAAERFLLEQLQEEAMDPKDKELRDLKKYKEEMEAEKERIKAEREKQALAEQEAKYAQEFQKTIIDALGKSGLPKSPEMVKRFASIMQKNLELGLELTADDLVDEVKSDITSIIKSIVGEADGDHLINLFGEDVANKIRKSDIRKLQEKQGQVFQQRSTKQEAAPQPKSGRPMTMAEWKRSLEERVK